MRHSAFIEPARKLLPFSKPLLPFSKPSPQSPVLKFQNSVGLLRGKSTWPERKDAYPPNPPIAHRRGDISADTPPTTTVASKIALPHRRFTPPITNARPHDIFALTTTSTTHPPRFINKTDPSQLLIFCDGIHRNIPTPGGLGVCFSSNGNLIASLTPFGDGQSYTYNGAQLQAAITALQHRDWRAEGFTKLVVACSVPYIVDGVSGRVFKWEKRGWMTVDEVPVVNREFWIELLEILEELDRKGLDVQFWAVRKLDNLAVELAEAAIEMADARGRVVGEEMVKRWNNRQRMAGLLLVGGTGIMVGLIATKFDIDIGTLGFK